MSFYAVRVGRCPGVYLIWADCQAQVLKCPGAVFKKFPNRAEAEAFVTGAEPAGAALNPQALYVDGGHNAMTGAVAWGCVTDVQGRCVLSDKTLHLSDLVFHTHDICGFPRICIVANFTDVATQQNNGAELLALVVALRVIHLFPNFKTIYSDSSTMVNYWSKGHIKADTLAAMDVQKKKLIEELIHRRQDFEACGGSIQTVAGDKNPADLGYH